MEQLGEMFLIAGSLLLLALCMEKEIDEVFLNEENSIKTEMKFIENIKEDLKDGKIKN